MHKKKRIFPVNTLAVDRQVYSKPRLYRFPQLHQKLLAQSQPEQMHNSISDAARETQFQQAFQDGLNTGFAQGIEEGKEAGYQDGLRRGFDEGIRTGHSEGRMEAHRQFMEAAKPLERIVISIESFFSDYEQRRREELLQLVEKVTRQVIRCELSLHPTQILTLVEEALSALPHPPEQIKVLLNSDEYRRINEVDPEKAAQWGLAADPNLPLGECRIITKTTEMDVGCQHRLDQCMDTLKANFLPEARNE